MISLIASIVALALSVAALTITAGTRRHRGPAHIHPTDKHEVKAVGGIVHMKPSAPSVVYACINPDCRAIWATEPPLGCPSCFTGVSTSHGLSGAYYGTVKRQVQRVPL